MSRVSTRSSVGSKFIFWHPSSKLQHRLPAGRSAAPRLRAGSQASRRWRQGFQGGQNTSLYAPFFPSRSTRPLPAPQDGASPSAAPSPSAAQVPTPAPPPAPCAPAWHDGSDQTAPERSAKGRGHV